MAGSCFTIGWTVLPEPDSGDDDDDGAGGFMDFLPAGQTTLLATPGDKELDLFDTVTQTWTAGAALPFDIDDYTGGAFVGGKLYFIAHPNVIAYDPVANSWATLAAVTANLTQNLTVHDDSGKVYTFSDDDAAIVYDIATNSVTSVPTTITDDVDEPRVVWDGTTKLLYIAPDFMRGVFYSIATARWSGFGNLPFDKGDDGSCTVSSSGQLYVTSGEGNFGSTRLPTP